MHQLSHMFDFPKGSKHETTINYWLMQAFHVLNVTFYLFNIKRSIRLIGVSDLYEKQYKPYMWFISSQTIGVNLLIGIHPLWMNFNYV